MPKKHQQINKIPNGKVRRGNKFSRKTCSVLVGDLVYQSAFLDSNKYDFGIVLETFLREDEWFAKVHWANDKVTDIYALYLIVASAIDE